MFRVSLLLSALFFALLAAAQDAQSLALLAKNLDSHRVTPIGKLQFNAEAAIMEATDVPESFEVENGSYCLGAHVQGGFKCYTYVGNLEFPISYNLKLVSKPTGELVSLSFSHSDTPGITTRTQYIAPGPEPIIKKTTPSSQVPTTPGAQLAEEGEGKSFIQKYWMYIVPVVIILMMAPGEEAQGTVAPH